MSGFKLDEFSRITLIGDSITAGRGSSDCKFNGDYIIKLDGRPYYGQTGKKCYASVLADYISEKYPGAVVKNKGCNGINSNHMCKYLKQLTDIDDTIVMIMIGANNRKLPYGMELLYHDLYRAIRHLTRMGVEVVLLTECVSTEANESRKNRRYHMPEVADVVRRVAEETGVIMVDCYQYLEDYMEENNVTVEELMLPKEEISGYNLPADEDDYDVDDWNRVPDGLHPPDSVHRLMAECIIETLEL